MAETLKRLWRGEALRPGRGLLRGEAPERESTLEKLERLERVSRLASDSMEDWRELKDRLLASSSICMEEKVDNEGMWWEYHRDVVGISRRCMGKM